jgi:hypothetical protein
MREVALYYSKCITLPALFNLIIFVRSYEPEITFNMDEMEEIEGFQKTIFFLV